MQPVGLVVDDEEPGTVVIVDPEDGVDGSTEVSGRAQGADSFRQVHEVRGVGSGLRRLGHDPAHVGHSNLGVCVGQPEVEAELV